MPPRLDEPMTKEEAGAYFKALRLRGKWRLQDVVDATTVPNAQYLSALEGGRYNILNSEHFPSLVKFFRLTAEEVEQIRPGTLVVVAPEPEAPVEVAPDSHSIPDALAQAIELHARRFPDLLDPAWQRYLAGFRWRHGEPDDPEAWLDLYRDLARAGIVPGGN